MQALPGAIPRGDIKFRQALVVFVIFHWHTPRIELGASLSKAGEPRKIDSRECSVRYEKIRHQNSVFGIYRGKAFLGTRKPARNTAGHHRRRVRHGCAECELDVT